MKVLIVEDDVSMLLLLKRILLANRHEVFTAKNGEEAFSILKSSGIDIIITDWLMPVINGPELISLARTLPDYTPVIMLTTLNSIDARIKALESGADEFISKPFNVKEIPVKIEEVFNRKTFITRHSGNKDIQKHNRTKNIFGLGIAASTGGPKTVMTVIENLGTLPNTATFIVLHGPKWMLETFADRLQTVTEMKVNLAENKMKILPNNIYLAPGECHMVIEPEQFEIKLTDDPPENYVKPSADPLFKSIAYTFGKKSIGLVLTGMGKDGCIGSGYISASNGIVLAEDPENAIMPSMPQTVIELKIAHQVLGLDTLGNKIREIVGLNSS